MPKNSAKKDLVSGSSHMCQKVLGEEDDDNSTWSSDMFSGLGNIVARPTVNERSRCLTQATYEKRQLGDWPKSNTLI